MLSVPLAQIWPPLDQIIMEKPPHALYDFEIRSDHKLWFKNRYCISRFDNPREIYLKKKKLPFSLLAEYYFSSEMIYGSRENYSRRILGVQRNSSRKSESSFGKRTLSPGGSKTRRDVWRVHHRQKIPRSKNISRLDREKFRHISIQKRAEEGAGGGWERGGLSCRSIQARRR